MGRYDYGFSAYPEYVPVAEKRARALKEAQKLSKKGVKLSPVTIEGRTIARTFWGKAWCQNLEAYSDYASRLPRGRSYVTHGAVIDLQITQGAITAMVKGTSLYRLSVNIKPLAPKRWEALKAKCSGSIDSLVELLQGKLSKGVMAAVTDAREGLFPAPSEITMDCSCPDWAGLCKHLAAALYGVGARLDAQPELLFTLRGVDPTELLTTPVGVGASATDLGGADLGALFGIEMAPGPPTTPSPKTRKPRAQTTAEAAREVLTRAPEKTAKESEKSVKAPEKAVKAPEKKKKKAVRAAKKPAEFVSELEKFTAMLDGLAGKKK